MGLKSPQRGNPSLDYVCTTRDHQVAQVPDPERLTAEEREVVIQLLKARHDWTN